MKNRRPNIVFVLTDDQGYGDLGCAGNPIVQTPNIDEFYGECTRLTNFHVGPTCAPTRSGLLTGHYANSTGVWHTFGGRSLLRRDEWTIADALGENGYKTGIFGKWHLGDEYPYRPVDRGFQKSIVHGGGGISQIPDYWGNDYFDDVYFEDGNWKQFYGYCTDVFFEEGLKFINDNKDNPFFCYIALNAPHNPLNIEQEYVDMYKGKTDDKKARLYGMITRIDENFGRLRQKLREWELEDDTILIFMTDNGTAFGTDIDTNQFVTSGYNAGMRGKKCSEYDGGHRVPFFIRYPNGGFSQGNDINTLTANVDFMPTLLDLCGVDKRDDINFHGTSIASLLKGDANWQERIMVTDSQRISYPKKWRKSAVMSERWRLINGTELYDINEDIEQRYDVSGDYPEVVQSLRGEYEKWWEIVSKQYDNMIPILIGEKPITLTSHDLRNKECHAAWNQGHVRCGENGIGYWEVEVEEDGSYQIEVRRWPKSHERAISCGIEGEDINFFKEGISKNDYTLYRYGKALDITKAVIEIQDTRQSANVTEEDTALQFNLNLEKGKCKLSSYFMNNKNEKLISPYYIYVKKNN